MKITPRLLIILAALILNSLTAFSQGVPSYDRKMDSLYCFGPEKMKQILVMEYRLAECDTIVKECAFIQKVQQATINAGDSIIAQKNRALNLCEGQRTQGTEQTAAREKQLGMANEQIGKLKKQKWGLIGGGSGLAIIALIFGIKTAVK